MTTPQWVNTDDDGAAYALLRRLADQVDVAAIDTLWLFPTRRASGIESTVCVISAFDLAETDRRRVGAVRWLVTRSRRGQAAVEENVYEYATAPGDAVQRVVDGVMRRLGGDALEPPRIVEVGGDTLRWAELLRELGAPEEVTEAEADEVTDPERVDGENTDTAAEGLAAGSSHEVTDPADTDGEPADDPLNVVNPV